MAMDFRDFVQMIGVLGGLKAEKQRMALQERQLSQQAEQYFDASNKAEVQRILEMAHKLGPAAIQPLISLARPEAQQALTASLAQITASEQAQKERAMAAGTEGMTPTQLAATNQEAAVAGLTGMNSGQQSTSQFLTQLFGMAKPTEQQAGRLAERTASGLTPFAAATDQSALDQGLAPTAARINVGTQMSAPQVAANTLGNRNAAVGERSVAVQEQLAKIEAEMKAWELEANKRVVLSKQQHNGQVDPATILEIANEARQMAQFLADPEVPADTRKWGVNVMNTVFDATGLGHLKIANGGLDPMWGPMRALVGGNPPVPLPQASPMQVPMPTTSFPALPHAAPNPLAGATSIPWIRP